MMDIQKTNSRTIRGQVVDQIGQNVLIFTEDGALLSIPHKDHRFINFILRFAYIFLPWRFLKLAKLLRTTYQKGEEVLITYSEGEIGSG